MEHTVYEGLPRGIQSALTLAGGTSVGTLPPQRLWYLGDAYTVRGYRSGEISGDAFWIARAELSKGHPLLRPAIFADAGWAGARTNVARQDAPLVGVGAGATALDGLVRLDISHGLQRERRWRADFYFEVR
jgi:hemolysin activation/secretion protein